MTKLLLKGGRVVDPAAGIDGVYDLLVSQGRIEAVARQIEHPAEARVIDVTGCLVLPGFIDLHCHLREPGQEHKEDIASGTRAAALGGFTAVTCMPNTVPVIDSATGIAYVLQQAQRAGIVRVYPVAAITCGSEGRRLTEMGELVRAGAVAFSDDGHPVADAGVMRQALTYAAMFDRPVIDHCEERALVAGGVMHEGYWSTVLGLKGIPAAAEEVMVARDILLSELTGSRVHIAHVSTAGSVRLLREAKARGVPVTAEVTPHHLVLTAAAVQGYDTNAKVNPPLRTETDLEELWRGLREGIIDLIATDHAPHAAWEKAVEFEYAPFGMVGLETAVALLVDRGVTAGKLDWTRLVEAMAYAPAQILGVEGGTLRPGVPADITVIDPRRQEKVEPSRFASKSANTPLSGWELTGWPVLTVVGGKVVMQNRVISTEY